MNKLVRYLRPVGILLAVVAVLLALGFVERTADRTPVADIDVRVQGAEGIHFVDAAEIRRIVLDRGATVLGAPLGEVDIRAMEDILRAMPAIASAEVYHTHDGMLHVKVRQREPIVRVLNRDGSSFYIDRDGWTMPVSTSYTARVLVVTGEIEEPGASDGVVNVDDAEGVSSLSGKIFKLATFITDDPLWNALIDQVVVGPDGAFELIPKVGSQRVLIGNGDLLEQRFAKLDLFYRKGMPLADWRRYARIDLRFADQIVCTKRTTP